MTEGAECPKLVQRNREPLRPCPERDAASSSISGSMVAWQHAIPGTDVTCPHCGHRLMLAGRQTAVSTRKVRGPSDLPPGVSLVKCRSCKKYYELKQEPLQGAA
jgi:DNA-directed RNA polymerase subunit RPC12/RpoP